MGITSGCHQIRVLAAGALLLSVGATRAEAALVFQQTNLISDGFVAAATTDSNLIDPIGITTSATSPFWVANNGTGLASIYKDTGTPDVVTLNVIPPITIAPALGQTGPASPTGVVFNSGSGFVLNGQPATFIFATRDGTISGWNPASGTSSTLAASTASAVYSGLAIANNAGSQFLYAANFRAGTIDVFDAGFQPVTVAGFIDPSLPAGYAPFNVQTVGGKLIVTFARQNSAKTGPVVGAAFGFVDEFDLNGNFLRRIASGGALNSPWGIVLAPASFGQFASDLLIGNFGDGTIDAFDPVTSAFLGELLGTDGNPLAIGDLWGLMTGNGGNGGNPDLLYFTAGLQNEDHGLVGSLAPLAVPEPGSLPLFEAGLALIGLLRVRHKTMPKGQRHTT